MTLEKVKVITKEELKSGLGANGEWRVQSYIVETLGQYPKKYEVEFLNDKIDACAMEVGEIVTIEFDLASREYNGRYYYSLKGWKVLRGEAEATTTATPSAQPVAPKAEPKAPQVVKPQAPQQGGLPF